MNSPEQTAATAEFVSQLNSTRTSFFSDMLNFINSPKEEQERTVKYSGYKTVEAYLIGSIKYVGKRQEEMTKAFLKKYPD